MPEKESPSNPSSRQEYRSYLESIKSRYQDSKKKKKDKDSNDNPQQPKPSHPKPPRSEQRSSGHHGHVDWDQATSDRARPFLQLLREFWRQVGIYQGKVLFGLTTLTVGTILGLIPPFATKLAIDCALTKPPMPLPTFFPSEWNAWSKMGLLVAIALIAVAISMVKSLIQLWGRWVSTQAVNQLQATLRRRVFRHILHLPLHRVQAIKSGGATSMIRDDAGGVAELIFSMLYNPWQAIVQLLGSFVVLVLVDWRLLACGLLMIPAVYFSHRTWIHRIRPMYRDVRSQRQRVDAASTETFGGIRVVRTFARQIAETRRFSLGNHLLMRQQLSVWWRTRAVELVWEVIIPLASTGLLLYGGWQILQDQLTLGDLLMFLVYLTMLLGPIATLTGSAVQFQNNLAGLDRILDLLEEPIEMKDIEGAAKVTKETVVGNLRIQNLGFRYPTSETWVLRHVDIEVTAGQTVALVGRSGAGKTTLCNLVARFFDPTEGTILLDGVDLKALQLQRYRQLLGVVEQDVFLFDGTVAQNIAYAKRNASMEEIQHAAEVAAAWEFIAKLPDGLQTRIGERGVKLSGGQRQRLAIARAILADPRILILDEATSNLDSENERSIQEGLVHLMKNRTCFVIAHRLSTIMKADQIIVLEDGKVVQRGTHSELFQVEGPYSQMARLQM